MRRGGQRVGIVTVNFPAEEIISISKHQVVHIKHIQFLHVKDISIELLIKTNDLISVLNCGQNSIDGREGKDFR